MRISVIGVVVVAGLSMGARDANAQRVLSATESPLVPAPLPEPGNVMTSATDSGLVSPANPTGSVCTTANENATACFGITYDVSSNLINPAFRAAGGTIGVNLCDVVGATCALAGTDPANTISDQLYLQVGAQNVAANTNSLTWCWDSDLEPNVNICQNQINVANPIQVLESQIGAMDLTALFAGPAGPLAAGQWVVRAQSEVPEPASIFLLGGVVAICASRLRKRKQVA
jgi:hypothetical protein